MSESISNISISTDTWGQLITKTNTLIHNMSTVVVTTGPGAGGFTTGNAHVGGILSAGALRSPSISGGNTTASANLFITSNVNFSGNITSISGDISTTGNVAISGGSKALVISTLTSRIEGSTLTVTANTSFTNPISANVVGNAETASKLLTARKITVDGAVTGNVTFDGSGNVTLTLSANTSALATSSEIDALSNTVSNIIANTGTSASLNTSNDAGLSANSTSLIPTQQSVKGYVDTNSFVIGQRPVNMLAFRNTGVSYQNTTGRTMYVMICARNNNSGSTWTVEYSTDNSNWVTLSSDSSDAGMPTVSFPVNLNHYYRVRVLSGGVTINSWVEYRTV